MNPGVLESKENERMQMKRKKTTSRKWRLAVGASVIGSCFILSFCIYTVVNTLSRHRQLPNVEVGSDLVSDGLPSVHAAPLPLVDKQSVDDLEQKTPVHSAATPQIAVEQQRGGVTNEPGTLVKSSAEAAVDRKDVAEQDVILYQIQEIQDDDKKTIIGEQDSSRKQISKSSVQNVSKNVEYQSETFGKANNSTVNFLQGQYGINRNNNNSEEFTLEKKQSNQSEIDNLPRKKTGITLAGLIRKVLLPLISQRFARDFNQHKSSNISSLQNGQEDAQINHFSQSKAVTSQLDGDAKQFEEADTVKDQLPGLLRPQESNSHPYRLNMRLMARGGATPHFNSRVFSTHRRFLPVNFNVEPAVSSTHSRPATYDGARKQEIDEHPETTSDMFRIPKLITRPFFHGEKALGERKSPLTWFVPVTNIRRAPTWYGSASSSSLRNAYSPDEITPSSSDITSTHPAAGAPFTQLFQHPYDRFHRLGHPQRQHASVFRLYDAAAPVSVRSSDPFDRSILTVNGARGQTDFLPHETGEKIPQFRVRHSDETSR